MAGNLIFCFRKRKKIITLSRLAQIIILNSSFDQKLNEQSKNYHQFNFWSFLNWEINKNIFWFPSIFLFFAFFSKKLVAIPSNIYARIKAHVLLYKMASSEFWLSRRHAWIVSWKLTRRGLKITGYWIVQGIWEATIHCFLKNFSRNASLELKLLMFVLQRIRTVSKVFKIKI